jgi:hypothetical protein
VGSGGHGVSEKRTTGRNVLPTRSEVSQNYAQVDLL